MRGAHHEAATDSSWELWSGALYLECNFCAQQLPFSGLAGSAAATSLACTPSTPGWKKEDACEGFKTVQRRMIPEANVEGGGDIRSTYNS